MAENHHNLSSYVFCGNNSIKNVDPDGQDYYLSLQSGRVYYIEGTHDLCKHGYVRILEGDGSTPVDAIDDALTSLGYNFRRSFGTIDHIYEVDTKAQYKKWLDHTAMREIFSPEIVTTVVGLGMMGMSQISSTIRGLAGASRVAASAAAQKSLVESGVKAVMKNPNNLSHIFQAKHNLSPLVSSLGGQ